VHPEDSAPSARRQMGSRLYFAAVPPDRRSKAQPGDAARHECRFCEISQAIALLEERGGCEM
jgi:hypothetical protein